MFEFKTIINAIKNLEWKKYFYKNLAICFTVLFALFFAIVIAVVNNYKAVVENEQERYCLEVCNNTANRLDGILKEQSKSYERLVTEKSSDFLILANSKDITGEVVVEIINDLRETLGEYVNNGIESIYVYCPMNDYIVSTGHEFSSNFKDKFNDTEWIDEFAKEKRSVMLRNAEGVRISKKYLTIIRSISNNKREGIIAYNINVEEFKSKINENIENIYVIDKEGNIVITLDDKFINKNISEIGEKSDILKKYMNGSKKVGVYDDIMFAAANVGDNEYNMVLEIDNSGLISGWHRTKIIFALLIILVVIVAFLQAFWLVMKLYSNLLDLVIAVNGSEARTDKEKSISEVTFVKNKILQMIDKNARIETELANKINLVNKTKMEALQSQINPHFVYNTLNLISLLDIKETKRDTDTARAVFMFSEIIRYAMDKNDYNVPLEKEAEYTKKYVEIQKLKFRDGLDIEFEIPEETKNIKVIRMTIQPIIENAIFHGVQPSGRNCRICVRSYIEDNMLKISVTDNGIGISGDELETLRMNMNNEKLDKAHTHGLMNVNQRCVLLYGNEYGCDVNSADGITEVIIKYPIFRYEKDE